MNPNPTQATEAQLKAKFQALTTNQRNILAQRLALQLDTIENNRALAILAFEDNTDPFTSQKESVQKQIDILDSVINPL